MWEWLSSGGRKGIEERNVQFPCRAASWYRWFPKTVLVLFNRSVTSSSDLPSITSLRRSTLLRRAASMRSSAEEAPC